MKEIEIWKPVSGYEGLYEVSNYGRVRSVYRYKKVLKEMVSNSGYARVDLFRDGKRKQYSVHRLVALAFIEKNDDKNVVNHKDENKLNNNANNLEWVDHKENCRYGTAISRRTEHFDYKNRKINNKHQIEVCSKPVFQYSKNMELIKKHKSLTDCAKKLNLSISGISSAIKRGNLTKQGFYLKGVI